MFIGHFGAGLISKKIDSRPSLGTIFMASQFIDLIWPLFLLIGLEKVKIDPGNTAFTPLNFIYYPFSHSFTAVVIWGLLFGVIYYIFRKDLKVSIMLGALVLSHWILDLISHRPDLPLLISNDFMVGLGLWNSIFFTILIEGGIFILGVYFYLKVTEPKNRIGNISFWSLIVFLVIIYIMNILGPPPPSIEPIAYMGLSQWLIVLWGYWIDKNRKAV